MAVIEASAAGGKWSEAAAWVGAKVPGKEDDVVLAAASGPITVAATSECRSLEGSAYKSTLTINVVTQLRIGSTTSNAGLAMKLGAAAKLAGPGELYFVSESAEVQKITTGGVTMPITVRFLKGKYQLEDKYQFTESLRVEEGKPELNTNGQEVVGSGGGSTIRLFGEAKIVLGASLIKLEAVSGSAWEVAPTCTVEAGTSTIELIGESTAQKVFVGGGKTYNKVVLGNVSGKAEKCEVEGSNTFATLVIRTLAVPQTEVANGRHGVLFQAGSTQTITTLELQAGATETAFIRIESKEKGVKAKLKVAAGTVTCTGLSFRDIAAEGGATFSAVKAEDRGGNEGFTGFTYNSIEAALGGGNWSKTTTWTGGVIPRANDDVVLPNTTAVVEADKTENFCRSLDATNYTRNLQVGSGKEIIIGSSTSGPGGLALKLGAGMTMGQSITGSIEFTGTSATVQKITTNGVKIENPIRFVANGKWQLMDKLEQNKSREFELREKATVETNGNEVIVGLLLVQSGATELNNSAGALIKVTGESSEVVRVEAPVNGTGNIEVAGAGATEKRVHGTQPYSKGNFVIASENVRVNGNATIPNLVLNTAGLPNATQIQAGTTTTIETLATNGESGRPATLTSSNAGELATVAPTKVVEVSNLAMRDIQTSPANNLSSHGGGGLNKGHNPGTRFPEEEVTPAQWQQRPPTMFSPSGRLIALLAPYPPNALFVAHVPQAFASEQTVAQAQGVTLQRTITRNLTAEGTTSVAGKNTPGPEVDNGFTPNFKVAHKFTTTQAGTISSLKLYVFAPGGATHTQKLRAVIYSDNAGTPENLLAVGSEIIYTPEAGKNVDFPGVEGWLTLPLETPLAVEAGTIIWLGWIEGESEKGFGIRWDKVANARAYNANAYPTPTSTFGASPTKDEEQSAVYAVALVGGVVASLRHPVITALRAPTQPQTVVKAVALVRGLTLAQAQVASLQKTITRIPFLLSQSQTVTRTTRLERSLTRSQAQAIAFDHPALTRSLTLTQPQALVKAVALQRRLTLAQAQVVTLVRTLARVFPIVGQAQTVTLVRTVVRVLTRSQAQAISFDHPALTRALTITQGQTPTKTVRLVRTLVLGQAQAVVMTAKVEGHKHEHELTPSQNQNVTKAVRLGRTLSIGQEQIVGLVRALAHGFAVGQGQSPFVLRSIPRFQTLSAGQPQKVVLARTPLRTLGLQQSQSVRYLIAAKTISVQQPQAPVLNRSLTRTLGVSQPGIAQLSVGARTIKETLVVGQAQAVSRQARIARNLIVGQPQVVVMTGVLHPFKMGWLSSSTAAYGSVAVAEDGGLASSSSQSAILTSTTSGLELAHEEVALRMESSAT